MSENEDVIKLRDALKEATDILDEFLLLDGTDEKRCEELLGRFVLKMLTLQSLQNA